MSVPDTEIVEPLAKTSTNEQSKEAFLTARRELYRGNLEKRFRLWRERCEVACSGEPFPDDEVREAASRAFDEVVSGAMDVHLGKRTLDEQFRGEAEIYARLRDEMKAMASSYGLSDRCRQVFFTPENRRPVPGDHVH